MSNDTPVTLEQCIDWMRCNEPLQAMNPLGHAAWTAILSHLRASAAKGDVGVSEAVALLQHFTVRPSFHHDCDDYTRGYGDALAGVATQATPVLKALLARASTESAAPGEVKCDCDAGCNKCDPAGATFRDPEQRRRIEEKLLGPDCAPSPEQKCASCGSNIPGGCPDCMDCSVASPEQQGAERGCCVADCTNVANDGWYCLTHAEARAAELMSRAKVTAEDEPDGCDCPHASAARSCGCGFCRALNCTATAPALGLSDKEQRAITTAIGSVESLGCSLDRQGVKDVAALYHEAEATLRSLLERGGV
jgi:hypothetical protein